MNKVYEKIKCLVPIRNDIKIREDNDFLIVMSSKSALQYLNEVAKDFYLAIDGNRMVAEIADLLLSEYDVSEKQLKTDLLELIRDLQWNDLILLKGRRTDK